MWPRIIIGIVERFHWQFDHHFVPRRPRAVHPALKVAGIGHKGQGYFRRQGINRRFGKRCADAKPADNDRNSGRAVIAVKRPGISV